MVSDSGTLPEESSFYLSVGRPIPVGCIRTSTERPEALDKGCFVLSGIDEVGLLQSVDLAVEMVRNGDLGVPVPDYVDENVSDKVVRIVQSYVGVVNKMVWRKGMGLAADHPTLQPIRTFFGWVLSETAGACALDVQSDRPGAVRAIRTHGTLGATYIVGTDGEYDNIIAMRDILHEMGLADDAFDFGARSPRLRPPLRNRRFEAPTWAELAPRAR